MKATMTKTEAVKRAGGTQEHLAKLLGLTRQAVSAWPGDTIPELHLYRLKESKPRWFRKPALVK